MLNFLFFISALTSVIFATVEPATLTHAQYLSVVQIDHKAAKGKAQVLIKVFTDDLESVVRAAYKDQCQLTESQSFCQTNQLLIQSYFRTYFSCQVNHTPADLTFISATSENEVYWLKFTLDVPLEWNTVSIHAPFFTEIFSTQSNIIHLLHGDEKRFARLTKNAAKVVFEF